MDPNLPDHETWASSIGLAPHGRAWVMIVEEWPKIRADIDNGRLSPLGLIRVKTLDVFQMGQNHQVLAYAYTLNGDDLTIYVYDPNHPNDDDVTISLNISDPWHTTPVTYSTGESMNCFFRTDYAPASPPGFAVPASKLTADFTGDGRTDVALTGPDSWNTLPLASSLGGGQFSVTNTFIGDFASWSSDLRATKLVGDFNGDGKADIALTGPPWWNTLPVAFSNGNGSFNVTNVYIGDFAGWASDLEATKLIGDFNGDGRADIALTGPPWWNTLPVAFSNGNGSFSVTNVYIGDFASWSSDIKAVKLVGDFNGDGRTDVALSGPSTWNTLPVAFSNGDGSFNVTNTYIGDFATWSASRGAAKLVGDFNADGKADIALTGASGWNTVPVAFSDGYGGLNGDGRTDIAVYRPSTATWFDRDTGTAIVYGAPNLDIPVPGDYNGDGRTDIAVLTPNSTIVPVALSTGSGSFNLTYPSVGVFASWAGDPQAIVLKGDFNGDGKADIGLIGPGGWLTLPIASSTGSGFSVTNGWVGSFAAWGSQPFL
jgi:hypothetical protein